MGHKEDLLEGAKAVLMERGYANTTAREIVAKSQTNLASIGYHYSSLDALLTTAMMEMMEAAGDKFAPPESASAKGGAARFRAAWRQVLKTLESDRALMILSYELGAQAIRSEELRVIFAENFEQVREETPAGFLDVSKLDAKTRRAVGSIILALISGLTVQHLLDPKGAPNAEEITLAIKAIGRAIGA
jgi:AcrR family transcriptional regulator